MIGLAGWVGWDGRASYLFEVSVDSIRLVGLIGWLGCGFLSLLGLLS